MPTTYAIPNGRTAMNATTYTANGTTQTIVNADNGTTGFKPDFLWQKSRSNTQNHYLADSNRGVANILICNSTAVESNAPNFVTSFNTNGFSFGVDNVTNGYTMVGWNWVAGQGVNNTNVSGSVTSTVSANTTNGFSITTFTTPGSSGYFTVGHGLGAVPAMIIMKPRNAAGDGWVVYHQSMGSPAQNYFMLLNTSAAAANAPTIFGAAPTSTTFQFNAGSAMSLSSQCVMYAWATIAGFSQFGSYTGNASADGPFVYTGFRPKYVMTKRSDAAESWAITDSSRSPYNVTAAALYANATGGDDTTPQIDFLSNGFKIRDSHPINNANGSTYIYAAFAENPFKFANAR